MTSPSSSSPALPPPATSPTVLAPPAPPATSPARWTSGVLSRGIDIPAARHAETFESLAVSPHVRIERIVTFGQASPPGFWYDQAEDEFVLLLAGAARLAFEDGQTVELEPHGWVNVPARVRHRVEWTTPDEPTIWLAIFSPAC
jgi:cupin 2 domain-containing protein